MGISPSHLPHGRLDDIFSTSSKTSWSPVANFCSLWLNLPWPSPPSCGSGSTRLEEHKETRQRIAGVRHIYWCSEPLNEAGELRDLSPRTLPRWLERRRA